MLQTIPENSFFLCLANDASNAPSFDFGKFTSNLTYSTTQFHAFVQRTFTVTSWFSRQMGTRTPRDR